MATAGNSWIAGLTRSFQEKEFKKDLHRALVFQKASRLQTTGITSQPNVALAPAVPAAVWTRRPPTPGRALR